MKARYPNAPLSRFVEVIWLSEEAVPGPDVFALPTGTVELIVNLRDDNTTFCSADNLSHLSSINGPMLCGVHSKPFVIDNSRPSRVLGVHFKPGGAAALLPAPLSEIENIHAALSELVGDRAAWLQEDLTQPHLSDHDLLARAEATLTTWIERDLHDVVHHAISALGQSMRPSVSALVDCSGFSHRRFNELFRNAVGLTPKRFSRLMRFQAALEFIERSTMLDWADAVDVCGFYDQAHLIHEFRRHAGMSPETYVATRGIGNRNHPAVSPS